MIEGQYQEASARGSMREAGRLGAPCVSDECDVFAARNVPVRPSYSKHS